MHFSPHTFLTHVKNLVTGGGLDSNNVPYNDAGYLKHADGVSLDTLAGVAGLAALTDNSGGTASGTLTALDVTITAVGGSGMSTQQETDHNAAMVIIRNHVASLAAQVNAAVNLLAGTVDETNARVYKVEEGIDTIGTIRWQVPMDYDERTDVLEVRILASMVSVTTDDDVELDSQVYIKTAGSALGSDVNPTAPGIVLSTTEQWITIDLTGNGLSRDDLVFFTLITNGANDTDGEEILIHAIEFRYRTTLVSYDETDSSNNVLR